MKQVLKPYFTI